MVTASTTSVTAVDLSRLAAPAVVEVLSFDTVYAELLADFRNRLPDFDATVASDPVVKLLQVAAYRILIERQRVNDAARQVMVAYATGSNLDHLAALFGVARLVITTANPLTAAPAVLENDIALRARIVLAPESYSVAGPASAYIFHALSADGAVADAGVTSPAPGEVVVSVLARTGDGTAPPALIAMVAAVVNADGIRPLTDLVTVQSAAIVPFAVAARLWLYDGPDAAVLLAAARARLDDYLATSRKIGRDITLSGIYAALHVEGVQRVELLSPAADLVIDGVQAAHCTGIDLAYVGTAA